MELFKEDLEKRHAKERMQREQKIFEKALKDTREIFDNESSRNLARDNTVHNQIVEDYNACLDIIKELKNAN